MIDVQGCADERGISIQKVGVKEIYLPFLIQTKNGDYQTVSANIQLTVDLSMENKGTHMSRFIEVLNEWRQKTFSNKELESLLENVLERLDASSAHMDIHFKYFIEKTAPVSLIKSVVDYDCTFSGVLSKENGFEFTLGVVVPFTALCPCSKEISRFGAHNQRGVMRMKLQQSRAEESLCLEDVVELMEAQGSSQIYSVLKREDEKYVTEKAYENPKFVEDVIRDLILAMRALDGVTWFEIECENFESIHNHSAYAYHNEAITNLDR
ncbi:GTP cyclohydrolase I FolE2 [Desulfosporosinus fructosivorans]|uniref:GTP cyclohydrolase FolE2 n=1 Tax=Desulfosporosinus fructosivorans TaxID=2018669 RepID=A0A4Z0R5C4_9FIRM|nr:GTP cyclohydrolase FolE2 [Desulfosporosinus fructosivorans]TGE37207.1 GTP cyclohydrolase I FolE2 [Desulfosporosinus fructosivorans]